MAVPLALGAELLLPAPVHAIGVLAERTHLGEPRLGERRVRCQLVVAALRSLQVAPRSSGSRPAGELLLTAETVEHLELVGRPREPALLELPRHRDDALDDSRDVFARSRTPPGVGARPAVGEDTPSRDERVLVLGSQLIERLEILREVELGLDIRLFPGRADVRIVALRAKKEPEGLGKDRLACAGLARDRVQPGRELQLRLTDEDEVLDAKPAKHGPDRRPGARRRPLALSDTAGTWFRRGSFGQSRVAAAARSPSATVAGKHSSAAAAGEAGDAHRARRRAGP